MSLFTTPTEHVEPPSLAALVIPLLIGAAVFLAFRVVDWLASATPQMPVGLIAGGAIALGGVTGWLWRWRRARALTR